MIGLVQQGINWASWGAIAVALVLSVANLLITLRGNTKRVKIRSTVELVTVGKTEVPYYRCRITNTGAIGLQIGGVRLYPPSGERGVGIALQLAEGEQERKLDQGESQLREIPAGDLKAMLSGGGRLRLIAVAQDTAEKEYTQKHEDSLPIRLSAGT